jgi:hypothetical protein
MAESEKVSKSTISNIWRSHNIKPHRVKTFKLSRDAKFLEKLTDVVGLYLNPPQQAIVLCVDEKSQIQALDRTQPGLPIKKGRCGTMTHDYKRYGTTTLFAALEVLQGRVVGQCFERHRHQELLRFLRRLDQEFPGETPLHLVMDNYGTHKHPRVRSWLTRHPRFVPHFVPTAGSRRGQDMTPVSCSRPALAISRHLGGGDRWRDGILQSPDAGAPIAGTRPLRQRWQLDRRVQQCIGVTSQPRMGVEDLHPGSVVARCAPLGLLIESSQPAQMTPVGTGQVPSIEAGQLLAGSGGHSGFQRGGGEVNPSLEMARAGLEHDTGVMSIGPHALDDGWVSAVEIDQDVAGISVLSGVGLEVDVATLAVAQAQKSHGGGVSQLSGRPKPFTRERPSGGMVNQTDQINFVRHRRELTADGLQSDNESTVEHGPNSAIEVGSCTMDFQRAVSSVLTDCLSRRAHPKATPSAESVPRLR